MANHVNSFITFENLSEDANNFLNSYSESLGETLIEDLYSEYDESRNWYIDNVGAKWLNFEEVDEYNVICTSAWSAPISFYEKLYKKLVELNSPEATLFVTYEDEMPNFIGAYGFGPEGFEYDEYLDEEDYKDTLGMEPYEDDEFNEDWHETQSNWFDRERLYFSESLQEFIE